MHLPGHNTHKAAEGDAMNIILFTTLDGRPGSLNLGRPRVYLPLVGALVLAASLLLYMGYRLGESAGPVAVATAAVVAPADIPPAVTAAPAQETAERERRIQQARLDAMALRISQIQAQVMRIEGLGQRLVKLANLDAGEFNFGSDPGRGGPAALADLAANVAAPDYLVELETLSSRLKDRERQLIVLEDVLQAEGAGGHSHPSGQPVTDGWLSSFFGMRADPFTGRPAMHEGVDFAGKLGSPVVAAAGGVVIWSGPRYGYGNLVEIDHGKGFVTRYGHNQRNLVRVGQRVGKGQQIARMGSSGRSTGPHVHFEVLRNGLPVNPLHYLTAAR